MSATRMTSWLTLVPFLAAVVVVALAGMKFMPGEWYAALAKPPWTPPNWVFAPAWTTLYLMIAVAGWLVWRAEGVGPALAIWVANLMFNAAWSWLMFGRHEIGWALADAMAMLITIVLFVVAAWSVSRAAALLFVPYLAWVGYATALNWAIFARNPVAG